jgi:hypothetical protein
MAKILDRRKLNTRTEEKNAKCPKLEPEMNCRSKHQESKTEHGRSSKGRALVDQPRLNGPASYTKDMMSREAPLPRGVPL